MMFIWRDIAFGERTSPRRVRWPRRRKISGECCGKTTAISSSCSPNSVKSAEWDDNSFILYMYIIYYKSAINWHNFAPVWLTFFDSLLIECVCVLCRRNAISTGRASGLRDISTSLSTRWLSTICRITCCESSKSPTPGYQNYTVVWRFNTRHHHHKWYMLQHIYSIENNT